jgi:catechol 2,3-dioxygenase-like lactoylglutathione lyase family enzyme
VKIDHIALQVNDIRRACVWYTSHFDANVLYLDETWALLGFDNIKIALILPDQHQNHVAIEVNPEEYPELEFKQHRDGSNYHYLTDPWGNCVELINYGPNSGENP